jgi:hypothetical protein
VICGSRPCKKEREIEKKVMFERVQKEFAERVTEDGVTENAIALIFSKTGRCYIWKMILPEKTILGKWYNGKMVQQEKAITNVSSSRHAQNPEEAA